MTWTHAQGLDLTRTLLRIAAAMPETHPGQETIREIAGWNAKACAVNRDAHKDRCQREIGALTQELLRELREGPADVRARCFDRAKMAAQIARMGGWEPRASDPAAPMG